MYTIDNKNNNKKVFKHIVTYTNSYIRIKRQMPECILCIKKGNWFIF